MPTNPDWADALPAASDVDKAALRAALWARTPYIIGDDEDPQDVVETDSVTGAVIIDLVYFGRLYHLDPDDSTTAHDGTVCLVTDGGKRYKIDSLVLPQYTGSPLSKTDDTNVTLTLGGAYATSLVAAASITVGWSGTLALSRGGTGASTAPDARTSLGLEIGADVLAYSGVVQAIAEATWAADRFIYFTSPSAIAAGTITSAGRALIDDDSAFAQRITLGVPAVVRGHISGLTLSNNAGTPNTKIDVSAGVACDDTQAQVMVGSAGTIDCGTTGANGLDTGTLGANTWYHCYQIAKTDGTSAYLASTSALSPTMPTGYTLKRRLGSFKTDGASHIRGFTQYGDEFLWATPPAVDYNATNPGTSAITTTVNVPTGVQVWAIVNDYLLADATRAILLLSSLDQTDTAPGPGGPFSAVCGPGQTTGNGQHRVRTNTSAQIRHRLDVSETNTVLRLGVIGWIDNRGKA